MSKKRKRSSDEKSGGITTSLLTVAAAFAGTMVGNGLRMFVGAQAAQSERVATGEPDEGTTQITITAVVTNTVAAAALAHAVPRQRALVGFLLGAGLSAAVGDSPDRWIAELLKSEPNGFVPMDDEEMPDGV